MTSVLEPALNNVDKALEGLESALEKLIGGARRTPQLNLTRDETVVNKKIAAKLDQTIRRLETLLNEE